MIVIVIAAALAALVHVYIFVIESLRFLTPSTMRTFGIASEADARIMQPWAFNQGFYNLFLGVIAAVGAVLVAVGDGSSTALVGRTLVAAGTGAMLAAALVLVLSDASKARAAAVQGLFPAIALGALIVAALV